MIPPTLKGKLFMILSFLNVTLASFFMAVGLERQSFLSFLTSFLCFSVWLMELPRGSGE